jgi:hypothetical protein
MSAQTDPASAPSAPPATVSHRSRPLAGALALVTGWLGLHRLYLRSRAW